MFLNRKDAGDQLSKKLSQYKEKKNTLILAIPRGGIEIGHALARNLKLPLDAIVIKKIGHPSSEEYAIGAVSTDSYYLNEDAASTIPKDYINNQIKTKQEEAKKRYELLHGTKPPINLKNKTIILTDDGIATGATTIMAINMIKKQQPKKIIVAIPVAPPDAITKIKKIADETICLSTPENFSAIGQFYQEFPQIEDQKAKELLQEANK